MPPDWLEIVRLTLLTAAFSTVLILPPGLAAAWLLARRSWFGKSLVETAVTLPLYLPPVATGLILLELFGRRGPLGSFLEKGLGLEIVFTWRAVVLACAVMSFPLLVRAAQVAIAGVNPRYEQIARTLGAGEWRILFTVTLPLAMRGIIAGAVLAFARAMGEFGATVVIAGMIPGRTMTLSLSIYQFIQLGQDEAAFHLLLVSVAIVFVVVWIGQVITKPSA